MPTDEQQATGLERFELLGKLKGVDVFDMEPLQMTHLGTTDNPIKIQSFWPTRIVGCTGYPADSHDTIYLHLNNQLKHHRCPECGSGKCRLDGSVASQGVFADCLDVFAFRSCCAVQSTRCSSRVMSTPATTKHHADLTKRPPLVPGAATHAHNATHFTESCLIPTGWSTLTSPSSSSVCERAKLWRPFTDTT